MLCNILYLKNLKNASVLRFHLRFGHEGIFTRNSINENFNLFSCLIALYRQTR